MYSRERTAKILAENGWSEADVEKALDEAEDTGEGPLPGGEWVVTYTEAATAYGPDTPFTISQTAPLY